MRESHSADAARLRAHDVAGAAAALRHCVLQNELRHLRALAAPCALPRVLRSAHMAQCGNKGVPRSADNYVQHNGLNMLGVRFLACTVIQPYDGCPTMWVLNHRNKPSFARSACRRSARSRMPMIKLLVNRPLLATHKELAPQNLPVAPLTTSTRPAASRAMTSCFCEKAGSRCRASRIAAMRGFCPAASASAASLLLSAATSILGPLLYNTSLERANAALFFRQP